MPHSSGSPLASSPIGASPGREVAEFWAEIRSGSHETRAEATRQVLLASCPSVDAFSFEVEEGTEVGDTVRESSAVNVSAGTPRPVVESWNQNKLVGIQVLFSDDWICGAAVGNDVGAEVQDFKACAILQQACTTGTHLGPRVKRMLSPEGPFVVAISIPTSSPNTKQVFSRPILPSSSFVYLDRDDPAFKRLLTYRFEPRVWKALFELFPGSQVFKTAQDKAKSRVIKPTALKYELPKEEEEVSNAPISSPGHGDRPGTMSFQRESLRVDPLAPGSNASQAGSATSQFAWDDQSSLKLSGTPSRQDSGVSSNESHLETSEVPEGMRLLMARVEDLERQLESVKSTNVRRDASLAVKFTSISAENSSLRRKLQKARDDILRLQVSPTGYGTGPAPVGIGDEQQLRSVAREVANLLELSAYATVAELQTATQVSPGVGLGDFYQRFQHCETEVMSPGGSLPSLIDRMDILEAARVTTAIEIGGYVFGDESACDGWARAHNDPNLHRFVVDFMTLFLLAEDKYDSIQGGLQQMAAVVKANYTTRDVATIELSYSMVYPPQILRKSDKQDATLTDGIVWATPFSSVELYEGDFNNGTQKRLRKSIDAVAKSIEEGIDYQFPPNLRPKTNSVFKEQCRLSQRQCQEFLDSLAPLQRNIAGGGMTRKESWERVSVFARQIFLDISTVRKPNSESSVGSMIWASLRTSQLLKEYQRHGWVEHPKTTSILALTSMRKEGRAVEELVSKVASQTATINRHTGDIKKVVDELKELRKKNPSLA